MIDKSEFISIMRPTKTESQMTEADKAVIQAHITYVREQYTLGTVVFAGPSWEEGQDHFAIMVLEAENKAKAIEIMNKNPAVEAGLLISQVTAFQVFLSRGKP